MKLTFLGTGAADWPRKKEGNGFARYLSSALVNDDLLIDPGPCVPDAARDFLPTLPDGVTDVVLTHSHGDHFAAETLSFLAAEHPVRFYATEEVAPLVPALPGLTFIPVTPFVPFRAGKYELLPLPASHSTGIPEETPVFYVICEGDTRLFYGLDGAWIPNKTFNRMKSFAFDAMVFDCTSGEIDGEFRIFEHNTIPMLEYMLRTIRVSFPSMLKPGCLLVAQHMARTLHQGPEALEKRLSSFGMTAAYDGRVLKF
ncbi:MAG: MBL fold metallo-hydrolase [Clostridia bacterium]|nr:MBL fold metallo-hydrolase [Clostridia bacterium]